MIVEQVWRETTLGDVAGDVTVGWVGPMTDEYVESGIPFLRSLNVLPYRIDEADLKYVSAGFHRQIAKSRLRPGDLVVVRTGRPGAAAVIPDWFPEANCSDLVVVRPSDELNTRFLMYYFNSIAGQNSVGARLVGSVQSHFNIGDAKALRLRLPPIAEQRAIASVLGALDDKIELNRRMNATLEAMARALFRSWFVDFDPVRAKADGRQPAGMDAETAALFPDGFMDSPLGEIPAGWEVRALDEIAHFLNGLALQNHPPRGAEYLPVIKIAELRRGVTQSSDRASPDIDQRYIVKDGDVLFSWSGSLEVVIWCGGQGALNQHLFLVTSSACPTWFYYMWLRRHLLGFQAIAAGKATTMGHIQRHHLSGALCAVAPEEVIKAADLVIGPLIGRIIGNNLEARTLAATRDALLPKLLSGELGVP